MDAEPYRWQCGRPHTNTGSRYARLEFGSVYAYHCLKVLDLADTVFFVLRKKSAQISFLHVYHHVAVVWGTWLVVNFYPGGHFIFLGLLNAGVHAIMYGYYFASVWRPAVKRSRSVKRVVTLVQIVQFGALIVHSGWPLLRGVVAIGGEGGGGAGGEQPCGTHPFLLALCTLQNTFLMCMFGEFYVRNYV